MTEPTAPIEPTPPTTTTTSASLINDSIALPRITIKYCTQCKWMLRAAYFAQELLSTFSTDLGEVALVPATGGVFTVTMFRAVAGTATATATATTTQVDETVLWDRKRDGGFPEVKILKSLVRNVIDPERDLGHTDRALRAKKGAATSTAAATAAPASGQSGASGADGKASTACEDCR